MGTREELLNLIESLSEDDLYAVERYARYLASGAQTDMLTWILDHAPEDDEPTTPEEDRLAEEAWQEYLRGESISAEEAKRLLLE